MAVILGSAFHEEALDPLRLKSVSIETPFGAVILYRVLDLEETPERDAWVLFRHGLPHEFLPHQINYRAHAWALRSVQCGALVVTSSVGVLDALVPLDRLLLVSDLLMPDNRLPDGSTCTMWPEPAENQGHLLVQEGLFHSGLNQQLRTFSSALSDEDARGVVFGYVGGPRTKTPAENRLWASWGAQVNSMTLGPEIVLANELEIPCAGLVVGHKYSHPDIPTPNGTLVKESLDQSRQALIHTVSEFIKKGQPVAPGNPLFRFQEV